MWRTTGYGIIEPQVQQQDSYLVWFKMNFLVPVLTEQPASHQTRIKKWRGGVFQASMFQNKRSPWALYWWDDALIQWWKGCFLCRRYPVQSLAFPVKCSKDQRLKLFCVWVGNINYTILVVLKRGVRTPMGWVVVTISEGSQNATILESGKGHSLLETGYSRLQSILFKNKTTSYVSPLEWIPRSLFP